MGCVRRLRRFRKSTAMHGKDKAQNFQKAKYTRIIAMYCNDWCEILLIGSRRRLA